MSLIQTFPSGGSAEFPSGGTTGQALVKHSNADNDVEWADQIDTQKTIKDNGTAVTDRDTLNFIDFDISDDSTDEETDIKAHRLTSAEMTEIMSTLPGAPTKYHKYSTTEQIVGEWIDGKPIYQKTIPEYTLSGITDKSTKTFTIDSGLSSSDIVQFWIEKGYVINTAGYSTIINQTWGTSSNTYYVYAVGYKDNPNLVVQLTCNRETYNNSKAYITIQYTKTTD